MDTKTIKEIERFRNGFPWLDIVAPATPDKGITCLTAEQETEAQEYVGKAEVAGKCRFVPASGAASRMFKDIFAGIQTPNDAVRRLSENIRDFAFYTPELFEGKDAARQLLEDSGLGYGTKPKGVLKFHRYPDGECRTAFAEHLIEGQSYMRNDDDTVNLTFTISPEHESLFRDALLEVKDKYERKYGVKYNVRFTYQDPSTNTVAVDMSNNPFLKDDGGVLYRPAGHGALIHNLNAVEEELVAIKNIDNVAKESYLPLISKYKKVLMGCCLILRDKIFSYLRKLDENPSQELCGQIASFLEDELCIAVPDKSPEYLRSILDRPVRVCGMVRNSGEAGGGPFIIKSGDGMTSLQILESVQIDKNNPDSVAALFSSTHFNPVDIVCCLRNYKGEKFDLLKYVDENTGFISQKSYQGRELKALELPGLWNGSMSGWNTAFVEVPLETFNPVKVVLDLLRPAHNR